MAINPMTDNLDIIATLDNEPNDVSGLTATELKETFDRSGKLIQSYINHTLIPDTVAEINAVAGGVALGQIPDNSLTEDKLDADLQAKVDGALTTQDAFTKDQVLSAQVRQCYGLADTDTPSTLLVRQRPLVLAESFTTATTDVWVAPKSGRVHALIIGGGGSGCAYAWRYQITTDRHLTGGAAGCVAVAVFDVEEGDEIPYTVGAGGAAVSGTVQGGANTNSENYGIAGGSSVCNGVTALGGLGGNDGSNGAVTSAIKGGQTPDYTVDVTINPVAPYGGVLHYSNANSAQLINYVLNYGGMRNLDLGRYCRPDGTPVASIAAGGSTCGRYNTNQPIPTFAVLQKAPTLPSGNTASPSVGGVVATDTTTVGVAGTDPGCGGGTTLLVSSVGAPSATMNATSAPGADGGVFLFWEVAA